VGVAVSLIRFEREGDVMAKKMKWSDACWLNVNDERGMKSAIVLGAIVALWFAISYMINTTLIYFTGKGIFTGEMPADEQVYTMIGNLILVTVALILAWRICKRAGHISAIVLLIWCIIEVATKAYLAPGKGIVVGIILVVAAINGVRGTLAKRKQLKTAAPSA
jgi:hypothetical protein